jgi:Inner membrane protein YgaP-like, transmembrane domain
MNLPNNESAADRVIRVVVGVVLAALAITGTVAAPVAYVAWIVAAIALVTGVVGFCPLYAVLRIGTKAKAS